MGQTVLEHATQPSRLSLAYKACGTRPIVHDFRNLVQCATSALRITKRRLASHAEAELATDVGEALEALNRAILLAHRLLTERPVENEAHPVSVPALILSLRGILRHAVGEDICVETLVSGPPLPLRCNSLQLENVLVNLAVNARDAMPEGGTFIVESRECRQQGHAPNCIILSATDTGCGMSTEVAEQATRPLFTTKPVSRGSGLGLSSVREFAEHLGGSVEIQTAEGSGTCIRLHLPMADRGEWLQYTLRERPSSRDRAAPASLPFLFKLPCKSVGREWQSFRQSIELPWRDQQSSARWRAKGLLRISVSRYA